MHACRYVCIWDSSIYKHKICIEFIFVLSTRGTILMNDRILGLVYDDCHIHKKLSDSAIRNPGADVSTYVYVYVWYIVRVSFAQMLQSRTLCITISYRKLFYSKACVTCKVPSDKKSYVWTTYNYNVICMSAHTYLYIIASPCVCKFLATCHNKCVNKTLLLFTIYIAKI